MSAVAGSWFITILSERLFHAGVHRLGLIAGLWTLTRALPAGQTLYLSVMLLWTFGDGALCGYLAPRIGRRAPLSSALVAAVFGGAIMLGLNIGTYPGDWHRAAQWFRVTNVGMLAAGIIAGGILRVCRPSAISRSLVHELSARRDR